MEGYCMISSDCMLVFLSWGFLEQMLWFVFCFPSSVSVVNIKQEPAAAGVEALAVSAASAASASATTPAASAASTATSASAEPTEGKGAGDEGEEEETVF